MYKRVTYKRHDLRIEDAIAIIVNIINVTFLRLNK